MNADGWSDWIAFWLFMIFAVLFSTFCSKANGEESSREFEVYSIGIAHSMIEDCECGNVPLGSHYRVKESHCAKSSTVYISFRDAIRSFIRSRFGRYQGRAMFRET